MVEPEILKRTALILPAMREQLKQCARSNRRTLNKQLLSFLEASLESHPVLAPGSISKLPWNEGKQLVFRIEKSLYARLCESADSRGEPFSTELRDRLHLMLQQGSALDTEWQGLVTAIESITHSGVATTTQAKALTLAWQRYNAAADASKA